MLYEQRLAMAWNDVTVGWWVTGILFVIWIVSAISFHAVEVATTKRRGGSMYYFAATMHAILLTPLPLIALLLIHRGYCLTHYPEASVIRITYTIEKTEK